MLPRQCLMIVSWLVGAYAPNIGLAHFQCVVMLLSSAVTVLLRIKQLKSWSAFLCPQFRLFFLIVPRLFLAVC
jgi:hypothetical protein